MKDFLNEEGVKDIYGSKSVTKQTFNKGLILDGETWMDMIESRNESMHTYNDATAEKIVHQITQHYYPLFVAFSDKMKALL